MRDRQLNFRALTRGRKRHRSEEPKTNGAKILIWRTDGDTRAN